jgi:hypothetical protein
VCQFVFVVLPREADAAAVERVFAARKLGFRVIDNTALRARLADGDFIVSTATAGCDCQTPLGVGPRVDMETRAAQLRAGGTPENHIAIWRAQATAREEAQLRSGDTVESWRTAISEALAHTPRLGLILHWFSGNIATEDIAFRRQPGVLTADALAALAKDTLHEFVR